jgi:hypothetical protein
MKSIITIIIILFYLITSLFAQNKPNEASSGKQQFNISKKKDKKDEKTSEDKNKKNDTKKTPTQVFTTSDVLSRDIKKGQKEIKISIKNIELIDKRVVISYTLENSTPDQTFNINGSCIEKDYKVTPIKYTETKGDYGPNVNGGKALYNFSFDPIKMYGKLNKVNTFLAAASFNLTSDYYCDVLRSVSTGYKKLDLLDKPAQGGIQIEEPSPIPPFNSTNDKLGPIIEVLEPSLTRSSFITLDETYSSFNLKFQVLDKNGILHIYLDSLEVVPNKEFIVEKVYKLAYGETVNISITAIDKFENSNQLDFAVTRMTADKPKATRTKETNEQNPILVYFKENRDTSFNGEFDLNFGVKSISKVKSIKTFLNDVEVINQPKFNDYSYLYNEHRSNISQNLNKLKLGKNGVKISVTDEKDRKSIFDKNIYYSLLSNEKYYALVLAVNTYEDRNIPELKGPQKDAEKFIKVISENYNFEEENITYLKNPTFDEIKNALKVLRDKVKNKDNLLIYYAGHGLWRDDLEEGFWFPKDSQMDSEKNWLSNAELKTQLNGIKSRHTLLISDACFSGSIFDTRREISMNKEVKTKYLTPSKKAITSGIGSVPDKSKFNFYLCKKLEDNQEPYISAEELFNNILTPIKNNSDNPSPQYGVIKGIGDEGGDFIFIRKTKN